MLRHFCDQKGWIIVFAYTTELSGLKRKDRVSVRPINRLWAR
jgi:hypothetical protein